MTVGYRPKQLYGGGKEYNASPLEVIPVGIQRLVLLCPVEELPVQAEEENLGDENKLKSLATRALHYTWDEEASELTAAEEATTDRINTEEVPAYLSFAEVNMMLVADEEGSAAQDLLFADTVLEFQELLGDQTSSSETM